MMTSPAGWISKCAKLLSLPKPVTSCQQRIGDLKSQDRLRESATTRHWTIVSAPGVTMSLSLRRTVQLPPVGLI